MTLARVVEIENDPRYEPIRAYERLIHSRRQRVMEKVGVQTLAELVSLAERAGILTHKAGD